MSKSPSNMIVVSNVIRTFVLFGLLFAIVFGLFFGGAMIFEAWYYPDLTFSELAARATDTVLWMAPYIVFGCVAWIFLALVLNGLMIRAGSGCRIITPGTRPRIENILAELCRKAQMDVPKLGIIETDECNAFASGLFSGDYTVAVTEGLARRLNDHELEAVIAHELTHIKNRDVMLCTIAATITGGLALLAELLYLGISHTVGLAFFTLGEDEEGMLSGWVSMVLGFVLVLFALFVSTLAGFAISRSREFLADAGAAEMTGRPEALVSALIKISDDCDIGAPSGVMQMCIDVPRPFIDIFSTHPKTEDRIAALNGMRPSARPSTVHVSRQAGPMVGGTRARAGFGLR